MISKKAQIERWIAIAIVAVVGAALLVYLFVTGLLPKVFEAIFGQFRPPSLPS